VHDAAHFVEPLEPAELSVVPDPMTSALRACSSK
jgi:hypothetical protein